MKKDLVNEKATRHDEYRNGNPPTLTLPANASRVTRLVPRLFPLLLKGGREQLYNNSDTSQSLINLKNLTSYRLNVLTTLRKTAFTLAEVLITLAVIGIVAAMTIPTVVNKYNQILAETRLKLFYSTMNNAIQLSEIDNGDKTTWDFEKICPKEAAYTENCIKPIFEKFFKPYLKITSYEYIPNFFGDKYDNNKESQNRGALIVYFPNGSAATFAWYVCDIRFYPIGANVKNKAHQTLDKDQFLFGFYPTKSSALRNKYFNGKGMEPYIPWEWDGNEETLPCLKKTQLNGWKFPDDCNPFK